MFHVKRTVVAITVLWALAVHSHAQEIDCEVPRDQTSMNTCAERDYKAADRELNETYRRLLATTGEEGSERLKRAQRAWLAYRDAQCDFDTFGTRDGSIHPMVYAQCLESMTAAQTKILAAQLDCQEGDTSCGGQ